MFSFNWLVIIWRERAVRLKLYVQGQEGDRILDVMNKEVELLKIGQFLWTSYMYYHLLP